MGEGVIMLGLFDEFEIIKKLNEKNIREIAEYYQDMNSYAYVKFHKNGLIVELNPSGWSDNEYFLSLLRDLRSTHRYEYIGNIGNSDYYVIDRSYKEDYDFELVPFKKMKNVEEVKDPKKLLIVEVHDCHDCPYYYWSEWDDKGIYYVDCDLDERSIESKEKYETKELFKGCQLMDYGDDT